MFCLQNLFIISQFLKPWSGSDNNQDTKRCFRFIGTSCITSSFYSTGLMKLLLFVLRGRSSSLTGSVGVTCQQGEPGHQTEAALLEERGGEMRRPGLQGGPFFKEIKHLVYYCMSAQVRERLEDLSTFFKCICFNNFLMNIKTKVLKTVKFS